MPLNVGELRGCCSGRLLTDFGEHSGIHGGSYRLTPEDLYRTVDPLLFPNNPASRQAQWQVVIATTNYRQTEAMRILQEAGFESNEEVSTSSQAKVWIMTDARWQRIHAERRAQSQAERLRLEAEARQRQLEEQAAYRRQQEERIAAHNREQAERRTRALAQAQVINETQPYRDENGRFARRPEHTLVNGDRFRRSTDTWREHGRFIRRYYDGQEVGPWGGFFNRIGVRVPRLTPEQGRQGASWTFNADEFNRLPVVDGIPEHPLAR